MEAASSWSIQLRYLTNILIRCAPTRFINGLSLWMKVGIISFHLMAKYSTDVPPANSPVSQQYGPISFVKVDQNFYAGKRVFLEEMEQGTCAYSPAVLNGTDTISGSVLSIPFQNTAMGPNAYCDPNAMGNPGCIYTSEGTPGRAMSNCQIEACCKDCLNADAAKQRGFKSMCPLIP